MMNFVSEAALRCLALAVLLLATTWAPSVHAQGFDVQRWNPHTRVPQGEMLDLDGRVWQLRDLRGKVVLINFWASWCEPCRAEMPSLQALAKRQGPDPLQVLTVNYKESPAQAAQFAQRVGLSLPIVSDPQGALARQWGVTVFPSTVLIGAEGRVRAVVRGEVDWESAQAAQWLSPHWKP